ncbi:MAG: glutathione S-transferase family protein [Caulobacteraceae bacterium]
MIDVYFWPHRQRQEGDHPARGGGDPLSDQAVNIGKGDQFEPDYLKIAPNNRMPAIVDDEPIGGGAPLSIFESGAIMMYLAEKAGKFWPQEPHKKYEGGPVVLLADRQPGSEDGRAGQLHPRRAGPQERRPHLRPQPLQQRGASPLRRDEPRLFDKQYWRPASTPSPT